MNTNAMMLNCGSTRVQRYNLFYHQMPLFYHILFLCVHCIAYRRFVIFGFLAITTKMGEKWRLKENSINSYLSCKSHYNIACHSIYYVIQFCAIYLMVLRSSQDRKMRIRRCKEIRMKSNYIRCHQNEMMHNIWWKCRCKFFCEVSRNKQTSKQATQLLT